MPPFVIPADANPERQSALEVVVEEDEDEVRGVEVEGGVKFTFPTSVSEDSLNSISPPPMFDHSEEESVAPFTFPQSRAPPKPVAQTSTVVPSASPITPAKVLNPRTSIFCTPTNKATNSLRASQPSRILPPSPPKYSQVKLNAVQPVPPPKRKPVPTAIFSPASKASITAKRFDRPPLQTPPKFNKGLPTAKTPSMIPQYKSSSKLYPSLTASSLLIHKSPDSSSASLTPRSSYQDFSLSAANANDSSSTPSSRLSFQAFTNFIPSLPWTSRGMNNVGNGTVKTPRTPVYVERERQLSKLRDRLILERNNTSISSSSPVEMKNCNKCQSDLISL